MERILYWQGVLGVRVLERRDGRAYVEVIDDGVLDLDAHIKKFWVPGTRFWCDPSTLVEGERGSRPAEPTAPRRKPMAQGVP